MRTQAKMYDLQYDPKWADIMTYASPSDGSPVGMSFLTPTDVHDLHRRREAMNVWSGIHHGFLGRSPDYMNTAIMAFYTAADVLNEASPQYADNLRNYYAYCRDNDITLSHAFIQPHASKISGQLDSTEDSIAAKIVESVFQLRLRHPVGNSRYFIVIDPNVAIFNYFIWGNNIPN